MSSTRRRKQPTQQQKVDKALIKLNNGSVFGKFLQDAPEKVTGKEDTIFSDDEDDEASQLEVISSKGKEKEVDNPPKRKLDEGPDFEPRTIQPGKRVDVLVGEADSPTIPIEQDIDGSQIIFAAASGSDKFQLIQFVFEDKEGVCHPIRMNVANKIDLQFPASQFIDTAPSMNRRAPHKWNLSIPFSGEDQEVLWTVKRLGELKMIACKFLASQAAKYIWDKMHISQPSYEILLAKFNSPVKDANAKKTSLTKKAKLDANLRDLRLGFPQSRKGDPEYELVTETGMKCKPEDIEPALHQITFTFSLPTIYLRAAKSVEEGSWVAGFTANVSHMVLWQKAEPQFNFI